MPWSPLEGAFVNPAIVNFIWLPPAYVVVKILLIISECPETVQVEVADIVKILESVHVEGITIELGITITILGT